MLAVQQPAAHPAVRTKAGELGNQQEVPLRWVVVRGWEVPLQMDRAAQAAPPTMAKEELLVMLDKVDPQPMVVPAPRALEAVQELQEPLAHQEQQEQAARQERQEQEVVLPTKRAIPIRTVCWWKQAPVAKEISVETQT
jgi:hypothetical protein